MTNSTEKSIEPKKRKNRIPVRYFLLFNSFFAFIMVYANKVVLSVAIVAMISETPFAIDQHFKTNLTVNNPESAALRSNLDTNHHLINSSSNQLINNQTSSVLKAAINPTVIQHHHKTNQVNYNHTTKARVLGAFFWGYIVTQVPAGRLAERFGAKWLLGISMFLCSLMSLIIPVATLAENDFANSKSNTVISVNNFMNSLLGAGWPLQLLRMAQGVCAGVAHPCMHALITRWTPKNERSMTTAFIYSGSQIGTVIIQPIAGFLSSSTFLDGWPSTFYLLGVLGTIWFILWCIFVYDTPDKHPFISEEELQKLKIGIGDDISHDNFDIPWGKVFTSWPVYALIFAHFGQNFGFFLLLTELPTYLKESLNYKIEMGGVVSSIPYLVQAITSWVASYISDRIVKSEKYPLSWVRKGFNTIGFFGPALCFVAIAFASGSETIVILSLIFALGFNGFAMSGFHVTHCDMAPDFAGTLMGITNGISNFNGIIAPFIVTILTDPKTNKTEWWGVFLIGCGVYVITNLIYCWFGSSKIQSWARPNNEDKDVVNVYVCDDSYPNGNSKKDTYLLSEMKSVSKLNGSSKESLKAGLLNSSNSKS